MPQSSITAWLKKPAPVKKADEPRPAPAQTSVLPIPPVEEPILTSTSVSQKDTIPATVELQSVSISQSFSLPPLPRNVELVPLTEDLIPGFKRLNSLTLPMAYPAAFYAESLTEPHHSITLMALWHSEPSNAPPSTDSEKPRLIGAIRCRLLPSANLYISTIGLLAPYRSYGIATHLLHRIIVRASREHGVKFVTAHAWEANEDGLEWYKKRGFEVIGKEEGYYRKLKPSGAVLLRKWIGVADLLGDAGAANGLER